MQDSQTGTPRIMISALRGGSGKTLLTIGITAALTRRGKSIAPFKKGPDYIDAGWLGLAANRTCYNLDSFLMDPETIRQSFLYHSRNMEMAVIEGNRGLYDGIDIKGATSTAELSKLITTPVILGLDCTKSTRTMAAIVSGCIQFDPDVRISGIILNRVAGPRHENILRTSIENHCGIPVVGAIPKLREQIFPERHMGLVPTPEHRWTESSVATTAEIAEKYIDLDRVHAIAIKAGPIGIGNSDNSISNGGPVDTGAPEAGTDLRARPTIGVIRDSAFQFYYPENLEAIQAAGADLVIMSPLRDRHVPRVDGMYIGGGFPETHAAMLAENSTFRDDLKALADRGLPIYAECGGLMYLGEELVLDGAAFSMAGVLPIVFGFSRKPQGHGYTIVSVENENPYFPSGTEVRGHEFHYSKVLKWRGSDDDLVFSMKRGSGLINNRDGARYKNVLATYTHLHALGTPAWAASLIRAASAYRRSSLAF